MTKDITVYNLANLIAELYAKNEFLQIKLDTYINQLEEKNKEIGTLENNIKRLEMDINIADIHIRQLREEQGAQKHETL